MDMADKLAWLQTWCSSEKLQLILEGECGFGRECVGIASQNDGTYPDYIWYDEDFTDRIDQNGEVWIPTEAYHKHPCVAVLGRTDEAISQLYEWCKWFSDNKFHYICTEIDCNDPIELLLGRDKQHRMVREVKYDE